MKQEPHEAARYFFQALMQNQCHICWSLFSDETQKKFIDWTLNDIYRLHPEAAKAAKLGPQEIKLMFETNHLDLIIGFWRRFVQQSRAGEYFRYGYPQTLDKRGKVADVEFKLIFPDGREFRIPILMKYERNGWRFAYIESGLKF